MMINVEMVASNSVKDLYTWDELRKLSEVFVRHVIPDSRYPKPLPVKGGAGKVQYITFPTMTAQEDPLCLGIGAWIDGKELVIHFKGMGEQQEQEQRHEVRDGQWRSGGLLP